MCHFPGSSKIFHFSHTFNYKNWFKLKVPWNKEIRNSFQPWSLILTRHNESLIPSMIFKWIFQKLFLFYKQIFRKILKFYISDFFKSLNYGRCFLKEARNATEAHIALMQPVKFNNFLQFFIISYNFLYKILHFFTFFIKFYNYLQSFIRYGTKIKNCSGFMEVDQILKVWSLLSPKILISSK